MNSKNIPNTKVCEEFSNNTSA